MSQPQVLSFFFDIFTTHIFKLEKMQCAKDSDPKPFDFLCWGPLMSSPLGLVYAGPSTHDVRYKAERYGQKTGKVVFCWDVGSDVVGFLLSFEFGKNVFDPTRNACV